MSLDFTELGIDVAERLRRLDKDEIIDVFKKVISKKRKDGIIETVTANISFNDFLEKASDKIRRKLLFEPSEERYMKTAVGNWLKNAGFPVIKEELPFVKESVADIVGFKSKGRAARFLGYGEDLVCAVELKRARASKNDIDRGFRQIIDFLRGADFVYLAVTPLLLWRKGANLFKRRCEPLGAGLIVADGQNVLTTLLNPKKSKYIVDEVWKKVWEYY